MEDEVRTFIKVWLTAIATLCYSYFISSNLHQGYLRFLSLLPVFSLFTLLPFYPSSVIPTITIAIFLTWLANFKLLLFSFGTGPLSTVQHSLLKFITFAFLPIQLRRPKVHSSHAETAQTSVLRLNWPAKLILFALFMVVHDHMDRIPPKALTALYISMLYLFIDVFCGFIINFVQMVLQIDLESPSDEPYMATSLQNFWGHRWNLIVTNTLWFTIYRPLRRAVEPTIGVRLSQLLGLLAVFLVSGLMHELLFYQIMSVAPTWEVTWFFLFHGICVASEIVIKAAVGGRWRLHGFVSGLATQAFLLVTLTWWFVPPLLSHGVLIRAVEECKTFVPLLFKSK